MNDTTVAPFSSECPSCGHERIQVGYTRAELQELLQTGADIEAYCGNCDEYWSASTEDRADIASALSRKKGSV